MKEKEKMVESGEKKGKSGLKVRKKWKNGFKNEKKCEKIGKKGENGLKWFKIENCEERVKNGKKR